jgi:hypothetical protein
MVKSQTYRIPLGNTSVCLMFTCFVLLTDTVAGMLGAENKKVMFLFTDAHVADEGFLELINNMLTSGMVPALYDDGEKDGLINR